MSLYLGGLTCIIGRLFASEIGGLIFWTEYFWRVLLSEFYGIFFTDGCPSTTTPTTATVTRFRGIIFNY